MTEYPDYGRLMENLTALHGDLNSKEKVIAFFAFNFGALEHEEMLKEESKTIEIDRNWKVEIKTRLTKMGEMKA